MSKNKKIINFPGGKVKEEISVSEVLKISGLDFYNKIEFNDKNNAEDFIRSLELFCRFLDSEGRERNLLNAALEESIYNIEARVFAILASNYEEYVKEKKILELRKETEGFPIKLYRISDVEVNPFEYRVSSHLAQFYMENKLYNRAPRSYYKYLDFFNERFFIDMHRKFLISYLLNNKFSDYDIHYSSLGDELKNDETIILSKFFYHILVQEEEAAFAYFEKLRRTNKYLNVHLEKILNPPKKSMHISGGDRVKYAQIIRAFCDFEDLFNKEYFFDIIASLRERTPIDDKKMRRYLKRDEVTPMDMFCDPTFKQIGEKQIFILWEAALVDKDCFLDLFKEEVLDLDGIGVGTVNKLIKNGVEFREE